MNYTYFDVFMCATRISRIFLDILKVNLDKMNLVDINSIQAVILYNIGTSKISVGDITNRGYYVGSNVSYNLKKMIDAGYVVNENSEYDKRLTQVKLTEKGLNLYNEINDKIFANETDKDNFANAFKKMKDFEDKLSRIQKNQ